MVLISLLQRMAGLVKLQRSGGDGNECLLWAESYSVTGALGPGTRKSVSSLFYHLIDAQSRLG